MRHVNIGAPAPRGSSDLMQTLLANDLIDEISMFTFPIVLGRGKKLFGDGGQRRSR